MVLTKKILLLISLLSLAFAAPLEETKNITANEDGVAVNDDDTSLSPPTWEIDDVRTPPRARNGVPNVWYRWNKGIIPYVISSVYNAKQRGHILAAMEDYHKNTCIHWVPRTTEADYVDITIQDANACWSYLGRIRGRQVINLGYWCVDSSKGVSQHELNHAVGFHHEQNRIDRDNFLTIVWENIDPANYGAYDKIQTDSFGVTYDYHSAMHYNVRNPNKPDMIAKFGTNVVLGAGEAGFSKLDYDKIRRMYKCYGATSLL